MKKLFVALAALALALFGFVPVAHAAPVTVSNGIKIQFTSSPDTPPDPNASSWCSMGPVGTDAAGHKVGITAGHCAGAPPDWYDRELTDAEAAQAIVWDLNNLAQGPIGQVRKIGSVNSDATRDWMVIRFNDDAVLTEVSPTGANRVDRNEADGKPSVGQVVSKYGATTGYSEGSVGWVNQSSGFFGSYARHGSGDSGSAVTIKGTGEWVGLVSRITFSWPPYTSLSAAKIMADVNAIGGTGAGFVPVNDIP